MEYGALMEMAVRAGEIMLASGAEVYRVEDTIHRILKHSGIARADVFVVTTGIVATIADVSLPPLTLVKRVENRATNLNRIYQVNNVSREFCSGKLSVREAQERLDRIANTTLYGFWKKCIGYAATTGFFAVMFGGGPGECLVAAVVGVVLAFVLRAASNLMLNDFCQNALGSFCTGGCGVSAAPWGISGNEPGCSDYQRNHAAGAWGHIYGGNPRYAEWRLQFGSRADGGGSRGGAGGCVGRRSGDRGSPAGGRIGMTEMIRELMIQSVGAFLAIFGFSLQVDMPRKYLVYAGITGGAGWLAYLVSMQVGTSQVAAAFFSSLAAALLSQVFARVLKAPVTIFLVAGILPTVPGASIYRSVYFLIQGQTKWYNFYLIQTIQIAGAMAVAIFIVDSLFRLLRNKAS